LARTASRGFRSPAPVSRGTSLGCLNLRTYGCGAFAARILGCGLGELPSAGCSAVRWWQASPDSPSSSPLRVARRVVGGRRGPSTEFAASLATGEYPGAVTRSLPVPVDFRSTLATRSQRVAPVAQLAPPGLPGPFSRQSSASPNLVRGDFRVFGRKLPSPHGMLRAIAFSSQLIVLKRHFGLAAGLRKSE
jgi:hypothetical protein